MKLLKILTSLAFYILFFHAAQAAERIPDWQNDKLEINLYTTSNKKNIQVLIKFQMLDGWHISWDNPGDAGIPVKFTWQLTEGWNASRRQETTPHKFTYNDIVTQYGYGDTAYYLFEITRLNNTSVEMPEISLDIAWTACREVCEPEQAHFTVLPTQTDAKLWREEAAQAKTSFPTRVSQPLQAQNRDYILTLRFPEGAFDLQTKPFYFIPYEQRLISAVMPQNISLTKDNRLEIQIEADVENAIPAKGLLIYGEKSFLYNVVPMVSVAPENNTENDMNSLADPLFFQNASRQLATTVEPLYRPSLFWFLLLAFTGGIILNCMPCVFPILSIKAIALTQSAGQKGRVRRGLLYLFGVLSCFVLMAFLLYMLRSTGDEAGWGFQLQSPFFIGTMLCVFIFLFLSIVDVIKIRGRWLSAFTRFAGLNSFMTGFFAVLIASPCTGPFMGAALGYALFQPPHIYFPIFLSLGLGYALPFTLVEMYPSVIRKILRKVMPKPGRWMGTLKKILSVPILLTCLWLGWVLYHETSLSVVKTENSIWKPYDEKQIIQQYAAGQAIFIDFTAKWCLTCLVNEKLVLDTSAFVDLAKKHNIALFKADWTNNDSEITKALNRFNRSGVPLYIYYPPQKQKGQNNYIVLPQLLTLDIVQTYLNTQNQDND